MHPLRFAQFPPVSFPGLNGGKPIDASRSDIKRALLMVGYPTRMAAEMVVGPWRTHMLASLVRGYLRDDLTFSPYFWNLEPSERGTVSFLLAQAYTMWAAQEHLEMTYMTHVKGCGHSYAKSGSGAVTAKQGGNVPNGKSLPDFIGVDTSGRYHVFESKGRSRPAGSSSLVGTMIDSCLPHALGQVASITAVLGGAPRSRTASVWIFAEDGPHGRLVDPEAGDGWLLNFKPWLAARKAYWVFLDRRKPLIELDDRYVGIRLPDGDSLGIDRRLLKLLQAPDQRSPIEITDFLGSRRGEYLDTRGREWAKTSVGLDGTILIPRDGRARGWPPGLPRLAR